MKEKIKIGYIGCGRRGYGLLWGMFSRFNDVEVVKICDYDEDKMDYACELFTEKNKPAPVKTKNADDIFNDPEIDAVVIMTPWKGRAELAIKAMRAGKYAAIEVGVAYDLSECYELVKAYEETGMPVMMLENCCYGRLEMMGYNVAEQGLFGELVHCDGGYHHYFPEEELFAVKKYEDGISHYRLTDYMLRNCETYPTHELGPIAKTLKINRGNRMLSLSSFASKSCGLKDYAKRTFGEDSEYAKIDYKQGDIVTTVIKCAGGQTIHLCLDTTIPRSYYSRNYTVRGTLGMLSEEGNVLFFDDMGYVDEEGKKKHTKNNIEEMYEKYDHPLYTQYVKEGIQVGHGGMDWLVCRAFVESVKNGTNTPIDAYDTAAWMAIGPLSEMSIANGGAPVAVPDFTKGKWMKREPVIESKYCLDKVCVDENVKIVQ